jgi:hypothetical protein
MARFPKSTFGCPLDSLKESRRSGLDFDTRRNVIRNETEYSYSSRGSAMGCCETHDVW